MGSTRSRRADCRADERLLVMGGPGCGKTVFALQSLVNGAVGTKEAGHLRRVRREHAPDHRQRGDVRVGPSCSRKKEALLSRRAPLPRGREGRRIRSGGHAQSARSQGQRNRARRASSSTGSTCCSVSSMTRSPSAERSIAFATGSRETGLTGIITQKVGAAGVDRRYGFLQFMVDCVVRPPASGRRRIGLPQPSRHEVPRLRLLRRRVSDRLDDRSGCSSRNRGPTELRYEVTDERISSGLPRLDNMLPRRLSPRQQRAHFRRARDRQVDAGRAVRRRRLPARRTHAVRELRRRRGADRPQSAVGGHPARAVTRSPALLKMYSTRTRGPNVEDQFGDLRAKVREHGPRCLVIDPLSALSTKLAHLASADAAQQFLDFSKERASPSSTRP